MCVIFFASPVTIRLPSTIRRHAIRCPYQEWCSPETDRSAPVVTARRHFDLLTARSKHERYCDTAGRLGFLLMPSMCMPNDTACKGAKKQYEQKA